MSQLFASLWLTDIAMLWVCDWLLNSAVERESLHSFHANCHLNARTRGYEDIWRVADRRGRAPDVGEDDVGDQDSNRICRMKGSQVNHIAMFYFKQKA